MSLLDKFLSLYLKHFKVVESNQNHIKLIIRLKVWLQIIVFATLYGLLRNLNKLRSTYIFTVQMQFNHMRLLKSKIIL